MKATFRKMWVIAAGTLLVAACAAPTPQGNNEPPEDLVYRTGSHIPVRDSAAAAKTSDRQVMDDMRRNSGLANGVQGASGR